MPASQQRPLSALDTVSPKSIQDVVPSLRSSLALDLQPFAYGQESVSIETRLEPMSLRVRPAWFQRLFVFHVPLANITYEEAAQVMESFMDKRDRTRIGTFINAHTLNFAAQDNEFRDILCRSEIVFGDGIGVKLAAQVLCHTTLKANLNGTDLLPYLFQRKRKEQGRVFLFGSAPGVSAKAAQEIEFAFPDWKVVGHRHGFFSDKESSGLIELINQSGADLLLVALGNPMQERWLSEHKNELKVPLCIGIGALLDYIAGNEVRAPRWLCSIGLEWLYRMLFQKGKFMRYFLGNPIFFARLAKERLLNTK
jgi:N-acetylglucosaminyldiphosphoundecaprenol N-acetyl-beta-D-mannosaminyltransferase